MQIPEMFEVGYSISEQRNIVPESTETGVAPVAQDSANFLSRMAMVDTQVRCC
jgi:hypothetical protein